LREDPIILVKEFARDFCLGRAMDAAGYIGRGRTYRAVRDIEAHADAMRDEVVGEQMSKIIRQKERILGEYEKIAFADDDSVRTADKLKALELYRALSGSAESGREGTIIVNYDYGEGSA